MFKILLEAVRKFVRLLGKMESWNWLWNLFGCLDGFDLMIVSVLIYAGRLIYAGKQEVQQGSVFVVA